MPYVVDKAAIERAIDTMTPVDPMRYKPALTAAYNVLQRTNARIKHIILLGVAVAADSYFSRWLGAGSRKHWPSDSPPRTVAVATAHSAVLAALPSRAGGHQGQQYGEHAGRRERQHSVDKSAQGAEDVFYHERVDWPSSWRKWQPTDPTSPWWYDAQALLKLVYAHIAHAQEGGRRNGCPAAA